MSCGAYSMHNARSRTARIVHETRREVQTYQLRERFRDWLESVWFEI